MKGIMKNKVYIVLINFHRSGDTVECIESILINEYKNYQIVVVDNSLSEETIDQMTAWAKKKKVPYLVYSQEDSVDGGIIKKRENAIKSSPKFGSPVIFIKADKNEGFSAGNNVGIRYGLRKGDGDLYWVLNNDTILEKDSLKVLIDTITEDSSYGIAGSKLIFSWDTSIVQTIGNDNVSWKGIGQGSYDGVKESELLVDIFFPKSIIGASFLIKKEVIDAIGLMREEYFMYHEETDWCARAMAKGYKLVVNCKSRIIHKEGASSDRSRTVKTFLGKKASRTTVSDFLIWGYYSFRNEIYFVKRNFGKKFILFSLFALPITYAKKSLSIFLFNDDYKIKRLYLVTRALFDGLFSKMGKTIDPLEWKQKFK